MDCFESGNRGSGHRGVCVLRSNVRIVGVTWY